MATKVEFYGEIDFRFEAAESNFAGQAPAYDDEVDAGIVPERGTAKAAIINPGSEKVQKHVLILDFGDKVRVKVGKGFRFSKRSGQKRVTLRQVERTYIVQNGTERVYAGDGILDVTHTPPNESHPPR